MSSPSHLIIQYLTQFREFSESPSFLQLALANHCLIVCNTLLGNLSQRRKREDIGLLAGFLLCLVGGYGGAILTGIIKGNGALGNFLFGNDMWILYMFAAWVLVLYAPLNVVHYLTGNMLWKLPAMLLEGYFVSGFLMGGVKDGFKTYPNSHLAPILFGTISATGGLLIQPGFINSYLGAGARGFKSLISEPGFALFVPFVLSVYYYLAACLKVIPDRVQLPQLPPTVAAHVPLQSISVETLIQILVVAEFGYIWFLSSVLPKLTGPSLKQRRLVDIAKVDSTDASSPTSPATSSSLKQRNTPKSSGKKNKRKAQ